MAVSRKLPYRFHNYQKTSAAGETIAFGTYPFSRKIDHRVLSLSFEDVAGITRYHRRFRKNEVNLDVSISHKEYTVQPIPPINLPTRLTDFLQIKFKEIKLEPNSSTVIFVTAPLEIAISLKGNNDVRNIIDVFGFTDPHFALYGTSTRGVITRFIESEISGNPRPTKNYREFLLRLEINNTSDSWATISRVILYMNSLSFYYDETSVVSCAKVDVINGKIARVECTDEPFREGMKQVENILTERKFDSFCNIKMIMDSDVVIMDMGLK